MLSNCLKILMICASTMACTLKSCHSLLGKPVKLKNVEKSVDPELVSTSPKDAPKQKRCCPYDFDSRICRTVGDRLLCGYNKNVGKPPSKDDEVRFNGGCRIRGGRIECGYRDIAWTHGPFTNPRRPLPYDAMQTVDDGDDDNESPPLDINEIDNNGTSRERLSFSNFTKTPLKFGVTKCVEIDKRIVCRPM